MRAVQLGCAPALRLLLCAIVMALVVSTSAAPSARAGGNCEDALTTAEMVRCTGESFDAADKELSRIYQRLYERLDAERQAQLEASQDAWKTYRDRNADFVASVANGGTLHTILKLAEMLEMTRLRADELRARLEEEAG